MLYQRAPVIEKQMTPEQLDKSDLVRKQTAALRDADTPEAKAAVMATLRKAIVDGKLAPGVAEDITKMAQHPKWYEDFHHAKMEDAADAWLVATPEQRKALGGVMSKKVAGWQELKTQKDLTRDESARIKAKIKAAMAAR